MTTLAAGSSATVTLRDGGQVSIATNGGFASVVVTPNVGVAQTHSFGPGPTRRTFGPFKEGATVVMTNTSVGEFDYDRPGGNVATFSADGQSLVDGAGKTFPVSQLGQLVDLTPSEVLTDCVFGQLPDGRFVGMGDNDASGDSRLWISTAYVGGTITRVNSSPTYVQSGGMQDTAGTEWSGGGAKIANVWLPSNGDILMLVRASGVDTYHLYRLKANSNSLGAANSNGSDASYSNKKAVLDLGRITQGSGAITPGVRALSARSFCEATIAGAKVYLFAEYNVSPSRTPGGLNDQVFVWQSTDAGATWTKLLTFNTAGSTIIDHFHGVVQDPYSGWIYFMTGDVGTKNRVIAWDGVSAAPAANASIATINSTAGWKCIGGDELKRYTDLCFGPDGLYSMPDSDTEATEPTTTSFVGTTIPRTLDYVSTIAPAVGRVSMVPPILALRSPAGWSAFVTFRTTGAAENYLQIWTQADPSGKLPWRLANEIRTYLTATATPSNFFIGTDGAVYLSGKLGNAIQFTSASQLATSVRLEVSRYTGVLNRFDGP